VTTTQQIITEAIREFPFWDYGMDDVDPRSEYAEWVPALAKQITDAIAALPPTDGET
jgi:hypothetical protein